MAATLLLDREQEMASPTNGGVAHSNLFDRVVGICYPSRMENATIESLKEILDYDPNNGFFYWKVSRGSARSGKKTGWKDTTGYIRIRAFKKLYHAHRLAYAFMKNEWPENNVDHINRIRDDNRWCNLRPASQSQNCGNQSLSRSNKSGYKGVSYIKSHKLFRAEITCRGRAMTLGYFKSAHDAGMAYREKALELFGEFSCDG